MNNKMEATYVNVPDQHQTRPVNAVRPRVKVSVGQLDSADKMRARTGALDVPPSGQKIWKPKERTKPMNVHSDPDQALYDNVPSMNDESDDDSELVDSGMDQNTYLGLALPTGLDRESSPAYQTLRKDPECASLDRFDKQDDTYEEYDGEPPSTVYHNVNIRVEKTSSDRARREDRLVPVRDPTRRVTPSPSPKPKIHPRPRTRDTINSNDNKSVTPKKVTQFRPWQQQSSAPQGNASNGPGSNINDQQLGSSSEQDDLYEECEAESGLLYENV
jgi:hypothetical protein